MSRPAGHPAGPPGDGDDALLAGLDVQSTDQGLVVRVRAQPGAARERIVGLHARALKVAVTAAPEKGKANDAIAGVLAATLGVPGRAVTLVAGAHSRDKRFLVQGLTTAMLRLRLLEALR